MADCSAIERALDTGDLDAAEAGVATLPVKAYESASAHVLTGRLHLARGRKQSAVECFETALALDAANLWSLCTLAAIRNSDGDSASAADLLVRAMNVAPETPGLRFNCARTLLEAGSLAAARVHIDHLCAQAGEPDPAHLLRARLHELRGEVTLAQPIYRRIADSQPGVIDAWTGLGRIARDSGDFAAAEAAFTRALMLQPDADFALDVALAQAHQHRPADALATLEPLLQARPGNALARTTRGNVRISLGDFTRGWADYEARFDIPGTAWPAATGPAWKGQAFTGRTLVVDAEQGFGDSMLAVRYLGLARARVGRLVLRCQAPLLTLMQASDVADEVVSLSDQVAGDVHCRLLSLPHLLELATIPQIAIPYLKPPDDAVRRWAGRLSGPGPAIGLVWSGLASATQNRYRVFDPADLVRTLGGRARLFGLQMPGAGVPPCPPGVTDLSAELRNFGDTAATLEQIDILVSAETAVAHLGGALGVETWIPMPMTADWRWRIGAVESPWYPKVRLFRQARPMHWEDVFVSICAAVDAYCGDRQSF